MECNICCETFNKSNRFRIECGFCQHVACRTCVQTFLTSKVIDPVCMNCDNSWDMEFLDHNCTKQFVKGDFRNHRRDLLMQREQCHLPSAQTWIAHDNDRKELTVRIRELEAQKWELVRESQTLMHMLNTNNFENSQVKRKFIRKCPHEGCKGFLSQQWKCDVCENWTCPDCNEVKGPDRLGGEHTCDPGNVETARLIAKDCKPCPNCGIMISKIVGCNQMWCTECNTAFDWKSLRIITGNIHNPHFFEARRQVGLTLRNPADIPCGGLPTTEELQKVVVSKSQASMYINFVCALDGFEEPVEPNNHVLRVEYLKGVYNDYNMGKIIENRDRKYQHDREEFAVVFMARTTITDLLRQSVQGEIAHGEMQSYVTKIVNYSNTSLHKICKRYGLQTLNISPRTVVRNQRYYWGGERTVREYYRYETKKNYRVEDFACEIKKFL